jgi:sialate O-acetylesterase
MFLLFFARTIAAALTLPEQIGDHMVLQQNTRVKLWGETKTKHIHVTVSPSWTSETFSTVTEVNGSFTVLIQTPDASYTPHTVTISTKDSSVTLVDVLIGEVFVASGQSNMEEPLAGFTNCPLAGGNLAIATCGKYTGIRFATLPRQQAKKPVEYAPGPWQVADSDHCADWSATAFFFAMTLHEALNVPVGILVSAWSGSRIENWMPREVLEEMGQKIDGGMVHGFYGQIWPIRKYTIRGFIWYQGESNVGWPHLYAGRLARMVEVWRSIWELGPIPFHFVEICPYDYSKGKHTGMAGALLREAQFKAQALIPNSGMIPTNDLVSPLEYFQIHPANKKMVGERLAYLALSRLYGHKKVRGDSPVYKDFKVKDHRVQVYLANSGGGLSPWEQITGFEVANKSGVFVSAQAIKGGGPKDADWIEVWAPEISEPVAVRYCFRDFLLGNVQNNREWPLLPFRSDDWQESAESDEIDWEAITQKAEIDIAPILGYGLHRHPGASL